jgi:hypothetical protein
MMLEMGKYLGRIVDYGVFQATAGRQHQTAFVAAELIGRYDLGTGELVPCPAETRTYSKAITPKTIDWVLADLQAIGYDRDGFRYLDPEVPGAATLFGREIDLDCTHEVYDGKSYERWSIHRERTREKLGRDELSKLDARYRDKLKRAFGGAKPAVVPVSAPDADEVPF